MEVDDLKKIYGVFEDQELAAVFGNSKAAISKWRKNGVPPKIVLAAEQRQKANISFDRQSVFPGSEVEISRVEDEEMLDLSLFSKSQQLMIRAHIARMEEMTSEERDKAVMAALASLQK